MGVRPAEERDIPALVELGRQMHAESPRYVHLSYSEVKVEALARRLICGTLLGGAPGGAFVAEADGKIAGMLAGYVAEYFFGFDKFASDYVVYVAPEYRGGSSAMRLVRAFERWAKANGAVEVMPGTTTEVAPERTRAFYEQLGYRVNGYAMVKRLG